MLEIDKKENNVMYGKVVEAPVTIQIVNNGSCELPSYAHDGDSGMDIRADFSHGNNEQAFHKAAWDDERAKLLIFPGGRALIPTGLFVAIPKGYEIQIRPKSGLALKYGITVLNSPGTVDAPYRGELGAILLNTGDDIFEIEQGMKIAQLVITKVSVAEWNVVETLDDTSRGDGGFGSTGLK